MGQRPEYIETTEDNIAPILRRYGIGHCSFRKFDEGVGNTTLLVEEAGRKSVLRIYSRGKGNIEAVERELQFASCLRERGIPIPRVFPNDHGDQITVAVLDGQEWKAILMEYAEGASQSSNYTPELIRELAPLQARMHLLGVRYASERGEGGDPWSALTLRRLAERFGAAPAFDEPIREFLARAIDFRFELRRGLPHGYNHLDLDIWGNVLVRDGKVSAIIDFDDLAFSPCVVCLGYTLLGVFAADGEKAVLEYIGEYTKIRA